MAPRRRGYHKAGAPGIIPRHMPWSVLTLCLILLAVGAALWLGICWTMAHFLLTPQRMSDGRALAILRRLSPADLGLAFEPVTFPVVDAQSPQKSMIRMAGWWIPAKVNLGRCVVVIHGYSDAKVGGIAWAPTFVALGWNVLAIDLRGHGESEGKFVTAGFYERHDVSQIIDQVKQQRPGQTRQLALFGISLGAAIAGAVTDLRQGRDIAAVIMDCPFADFVSAAHTHAEANGLPGSLFQNMAMRIATRLSGADFLAVAPARLIPALPVPLMVIHGADDLFVSRTDMDVVLAAVEQRPPDLGPTEYWRLDDTHHVLALRTDPLEFARRVGYFLERALVWNAQRAERAAIAPET